MPDDADDVATAARSVVVANPALPRKATLVEANFSESLTRLSPITAVGTDDAFIV